MQLAVDSVNVVSEDGTPVRATIMGTLTHPQAGSMTYRQHLTGQRLTTYVNAANEQARLAALRAAVQPEAAKRIADLLARPAVSTATQDEGVSLDLT